MPLVLVEDALRGQEGHIKGASGQWPAGACRVPDPGRCWPHQPSLSPRGHSGPLMQAAH